MIVCVFLISGLEKDGKDSGLWRQLERFSVNLQPWNIWRHLIHIASYWREWFNGLGSTFPSLLLSHTAHFPSSLQRQAKYTENKLKAIKARNEYLLALEATNCCVFKYYIHDLSDLIDVSPPASPHHFFQPGVAYITLINTAFTHTIMSVCTHWPCTWLVTNYVLHFLWSRFNSRLYIRKYQQLIKAFNSQIYRYLYFLI